jgi:hypothetical protein
VGRFDVRRLAAVDMYGSAGSRVRRRTVGLSYVPLAGHAWSLSRPGALDRALAGVDVHRELRYYTVAQLWIVVPLLLLVLTIRQRDRAANRNG